jgi:predicted nuclease of predicted toxin-antitoxin system
MKFIVDAHLPQRLVYWLNSNGHDAIHTFDLPESNKTEDIVIADVAIGQDRIVVTKDSDFLKLFVLKGKPEKLLLITTGNIVNKDLLVLFEKNFEVILKLFNSFNVVEMSNAFVLGHNPE